MYQISESYLYNDIRFIKGKLKMLKKILKLSSFLKKNKKTDLANYILKLASPGEPFDSMFAGEDRQSRIYLPYEDSSQNNESELRSRHPYVLEAISYMGFDPDGASLREKYLYSGARSKKDSMIGESFFKKVLRKKILERLSTLNIKIDNEDEVVEKLVNLSWKKDINENILDFFDENINNEDKAKILKIENEIVKLSEKYKEYDSDDQRKTSISDKDKMVVISRNENDVLNMSTDRNWKSCMDLDGGEYSSGLYCEVVDGGFVAYLIESDDKNIYRPLARIWIRRLDGEASGKSIAIPEDRIYGVQDYRFQKIVEDWVRKGQNNIDIDSYSIKGSDYSDTFRESMLLSSLDGENNYLDMNDLILNPQKYFKDQNKIFLLKDNILFNSPMRGSVAANLMGGFSGYKKFNSKEEAEEFIQKTNDMAMENLSSILYEFGKERIIDHSGLIEHEGAVYDQHGDYIADRINEINVHDLIPDEEDEAYMEENEEITDDYGNVIGIKNIFNIEEPYYSYEIEAKNLIENPQKRFEVIEIDSDEYYDNLPKYSNAIFNSILKSIAKSEDQNLSREAIDRVKKMIASDTNRRANSEFVENIISKNPDSFEERETIEFCDHQLEIIYPIIEKYFQGSSFSKKDISRDQDVSKYQLAMKRFVNVSYKTKNKNIYNYVSKEISKILRSVINSEMPDSDKIIALADLSYFLKVYHQGSGGLASSAPFTMEPDIANFIIEKTIVDNGQEYSSPGFLLKSFFLTSNIEDPNTFNKIIELTDGIDVNYDFYTKEGITKSRTVINLGDESSVYKRMSTEINSTLLIKMLKNNNNMLDIFEEKYVENILIKTREKISKRVATLKTEYEDIISEPNWESDEFEDRNEEIRFLKKNFKSEISAIRKFVEEIIDVTSKA